MLYLTDLISRGGTRECYYHPLDGSLCVKVMLPQKDVSQLKKELEIYQVLAPRLGKFVCRYSTHLVETNKGLGLESELITDVDGCPSQPIIVYASQHQLGDEVLAQLQEFFSILISNNIFFYDFNLMNFVVSQTSSGPRLVYIDMKSYRRYKPWTYLGLERFVTPLARHIMKRRIKSMYQKLGLASPFEDRKQ